MRQVKLYTLKEDTVVVTGDYINMYNRQETPTHVRGSNEFIIDAPIQIKQAGVERYVEFGRNTQEYIDWLDDFLSTWSKLTASVQDIQFYVAEQNYLNG